MANSLSPFVDTGNNQFSRQFDIETIGGDQRQRLAEMLRSNMLNQPQGQMVSGWYVAPNWSQYAANLANTAVGVIGGKMLDEERAKKTAEALKKFEGVEEEIPLNKALQSNTSQAEGQTPFAGQQTLSQRFADNAQPSAEQTPINPEMAPRQTRMRPLTQDEQDMAMLNLASVNPTMAGIYGNLQAARAKRAYDEEQRTLDRQARFDLARENQQGRMDLARMTAGLAAANRPEKMLTAMDENGNPFTVPQSAFQQGMTLYSPAAAKAMKEQKAQFEAKKDVGTQIQGLKESYDTLNKNFGITSENNKPGSNFGAWLSSTAPGQWVGRVAGTENATARDDIRMSRPGLMQSIVKASGMSAKQIDSNAELKLMLDQATDPQAGYEANMKALNRLEKRFGLGGSGDQPSATGIPSANDIDAEIARRRGK